MELKDRAKEARLAAGYKKVPPFAKLIGVESAAVYQIESGKTREMKAKTLARYEAVTGFRADYIREGHLPKLSGAPVESAAPDEVSRLNQAIRSVEAAAERLRPLNPAADSIRTDVAALKLLVSVMAGVFASKRQAEGALFAHAIRETAKKVGAPQLLEQETVAALLNAFDGLDQADSRPGKKPARGKRAS